MSGFWTEKREAALLELWPKMSGAQIASVLGSACTRSMVIAKANRLGLTISKQERLRRCGHSVRSEGSPLPRDCVVVETDGARGGATG
jgi:hypothetical protein